MTAVRRNHLTTAYVRSPFIAERRRKLFPVEDCDADSELGHITPIRSDDTSSSDSENECLNTPLSNRTRSETMSPLILSPYTEATPRKLSPSQSLKTPHDTSTKAVLDKEQKLLLEESKSLKRKGSSPGDSPLQSKSVKSCSKVRTALFPPESSLNNMALSTRSFYSKGRENVLEKLNAHRPCNYNKPVKLSATKHGHRQGRKLGQINNGVRHKIRKPKQKRVSKSSIVKATKKMLETGSVLTEYLRDLADLKNKQRKLIVQNKEVETGTTPTKNIQTFVESDKENIITNSPAEETKTRKFFKSPRPTMTLITVNSRPKPLSSASQKEQPNKPIEAQEHQKITLNSNDFDEDEVEPEANIDTILSILSAESPQKIVDSPHHTSASELGIYTAHRHYSSQVVFQGSFHETTSAKIVPDVNSDNSVQLNRPNVANMILSPISQMCDVTSGLALNSPIGKGRDLASAPKASKKLSFNADCHSTDMDKLFPIFCKKAEGQRGEKRSRNEVMKRGVKRFKALPPDQMLLDAGQKRFGLTLCNECDLLYHMGDPNDEIAHLNYHNAHHILRFAGWKHEHVVATFPSKGRIIKVLPTDSHIWLKKVKDLMGLVKRELGCYEMDVDISQSQVFIYVKNRIIAGCAVATVPKEDGHRMLSSLSGVAMCSEEAYPIKCGISHIWVAANSRKQGIASALVDAVKNNFTYGQVLTNDDVALTSPTEAGSAFAEKYFKTPNYLIYYT